MFGKTDRGKKLGSTCETRFKHKLNMLEPGTIMLKWIAVLCAGGLLLLALDQKAAAYCVLGLAGALFVVLLVLLAVEAYQDRVLNEIAMRENREGEDRNEVNN